MLERLSSARRVEVLGASVSGFRCHAEGLRLSTRLIQKQVHAH